MGFHSMRSHFGTLGLRGLYAAVIGSFTRSERIFTVERRDCASPIHLRIGSSDVPTYRKVFIDREYEVLVEREPSVIVDAGANVGLASVFFANRFPRAKILAIEPESSNFAMLQRNAAAYPNILPIQAALWHRNEKIHLADPGLGKWGFIAQSKDSSVPSAASALHPVQAMTVDAILADHGLDRIDIFKIDIEGSEKEVFSDTSSWIGKVDSIIIELHERMKPGCIRSFFCGSNGFDYEWIQGENVFVSRRNCLAR